MNEQVYPTPPQQPVPSIGTIKRFLELWSAGSEFKALIKNNPAELLQRYQLDLDLESIRSLWDREYAIRCQQHNLPVEPAVQHYQAFINEKLTWRDRMREECASDNPDFRSWRQRQMTRSKIQIGIEADKQMLHSPVAFELAQGCSVGCWFCGFDAPPLSGVYEYIPDNATLWQDILVIVREIIGHAVKWSSCYYATEPLDNPDYERFCLDFYHILGVFPQTTTALPLKNIRRTRALLELSAQQECPMVNRFSVLSLNILEKLYKEFHPDELLKVELLLQMQDADIVKASSGKFLKKTPQHAAFHEREYQKYLCQIQEKTGVTSAPEPEMIAGMPATISCVSGFLINMVTKRVKLISPCKADERWPLGYIVYAEDTFSNPADFRTLLETMIREKMSAVLKENQPLQFIRGTIYESLPDGFRISTPYSKVEVIHKEYGTYFKTLGDLLHQGDKTPETIALLCFYQHGIPEKSTVETLRMFFNQGMLTEEPDL